MGIFLASKISRKKTAAIVASLALTATALVSCSDSKDPEHLPETAASPGTQAENTADSKERIAQHFDLEAHRAGRGETTEESLRAFEKALDLGVTTLEFDIVLSKDDVPVVWHDNTIQEEKCTDTKPVKASDPQFPYVGDYVKDLTWEQLQTLDCGKQLEGFPDAEVVKNNKLIQLNDVFALVKKRGADVAFNIETKLEPEKPETAKSPQEFIDVIFKEIEEADVLDKVLIQSFDWASLELVKKDADYAGVPTVALYDPTTWKPESKWTGSVDFDAVDGDIIKAGQLLGVQVLSPGYALPYGSTVKDPLYLPTLTPEFIDAAHAAGMAVIPWTVNDADTMRQQILAGVDGIITDYPTTLRKVMSDLGMPLPAPAPAS